MNKSYLERLPIRIINFDDSLDMNFRGKIVTLVDQMLELNRRLEFASIPADKTFYQQQIEVTDQQIDALIYDLYDLTEEEIKIVENLHK